MSSEELLGTLTQLAENYGGVLWDWEDAELKILEQVTERLLVAVREARQEVQSWHDGEASGDNGDR